MVGYKYSNYNVIKQLEVFDVVLWHFSGYIFKDMLIAKDIKEMINVPIIKSIDFLLV